jgi:hypothetical protein
MSAIEIKGKPPSKGDILFEVEGQLSATDQRKVRLHVENVRALHVTLNTKDNGQRVFHEGLR